MKQEFSQEELRILYKALIALEMHGQCKVRDVLKLQDKVANLITELD